MVSFRFCLPLTFTTLISALSLQKRSGQRASTLELNPLSLASGHKISVRVDAASDTTFVPPTVNAEEGDTIEFTFVSGDHGIYQSKSSQPCRLMDRGIHSEEEAVDDDLDEKDLPKWSLPVNSSQPLYFFDSKSCKDGGVFVVNGPTSGSGTYNSYRAAAKDYEGNIITDDDDDDDTDGNDPLLSNGSSKLGLKAIGILAALFALMI